jgi:hypothetical protein
MALFLGIHKIPAGTKQQDIIDSFNKYKTAAEEKGISAVSAVYSLEKGFAYCQTEAESAEQVKDAHVAAGVPLEDVIEVKSL